MRGALFLIALSVSGLLFQSNLWGADAYPQRAIRLIVPYPPGGAGDIVGRMLAVRLTEALGQQVVVDNRGGGGQIIATDLTAKAPPDGHTLFLASATHGINPGLRRGKLPYDTLKDFAPITLVAESPLVFIAHPSLGVGSIKELIAAAKAKPGRINYASSGPGTGGHLSVEMLKHYTGIDMAHVPYKGAGPALIDLIAGQVQAMCTSPLACDAAREIRPAEGAWDDEPHALARGAGNTDRRRAGRAGIRIHLWYALLAPAATPQTCRQAGALGNGEDPEVVRPRRSASCPGRRAGGQQSPGAAEVRGGRNRPLDQGHRAGEYSGGLTIRVNGER